MSGNISLISVVINVKNGERHFTRCLNALRKFTDVVVLDNYSTDKTVEIANSFANVRLFQDSFCGMGALRNKAAAYAKHDWLFFVDSDEIVSPELVDTLLNLNLQDGCVYNIFRQNYYADFWLNGASWENDWVARVYNRTQTKYSQSEVHESIIVGQMNLHKISTGVMYHFPYYKVAQLIDKTQFYSELYARQNFGRKKLRLYSLPMRAALVFLKCYILKRGFRYGYEGLVVSIFNSIGVLAKYIKLYEMSRQNSFVVSAALHNVADLHRMLKSVNGQTQLPQQFILLIPHELYKLNKAIVDDMLATQLIIPCKLIEINDSVTDYKRKIIDCCVSQTGMQIDYVLYLSDNGLLEDSKFIRKCKRSLRRGKQLSGVEMIPCRVAVVD